jgi:hypothetical protein
MKTAMQELIEAVNKHYSNPLRTDIFDTNPFLKKEKEQIINAAKSCNYIGGATDIEAEKYYNQTYKPETI